MIWPSQRLLDLLGIDLPIIQAPMAGLATSAMAAAVAEAGGLGSMGCAVLSADQIRAELSAIRRQTAKPINLNLGLPWFVWVIAGGHSTGSMHGDWLFEAWRGSGIRHDKAWHDRARDSVGCRMDIASRTSARKRLFAGFSVIGMCGSSGSSGAQKNCLWWLRAGAHWLVRPDEAARPRPSMRRVPHRLGTRRAPGRMPCLRYREARTSGLPGGQSTLHQAVRVLCRPALPASLGS